MTSKYTYNKYKVSLYNPSEHKFSSLHFSSPTLTTTTPSTPPPLPIAYDIRHVKKVPAILDQSFLGDCVGNEVSNALRFCLENEKLIDFQPSRLFIYYFGRLLDGEIDLSQDTGMSISSAFRSVVKYGVCDEKIYPYDITKFSIKPSLTSIRLD
jgi:hypothetical protein